MPQKRKIKMTLKSALDKGLLNQRWLGLLKVLVMIRLRTRRKWRVTMHTKKMTEI